MQWTSQFVFVSLLRTTYKLGGKEKGFFTTPQTRCDKKVDEEMLLCCLDELGLTRIAKILMDVLLYGTLS